MSKKYFKELKKAGYVQLHVWIKDDQHRQLKQYALDQRLTIQKAMDIILKERFSENDKKDNWFNF